MKNFIFAAALLIVASVGVKAENITPPVLVTTAIFTPTISFATLGDLSVAYGTATGNYAISSNQVCFNLTVTFTPTFTTSSGGLRIIGTFPAARAGFSPPVFIGIVSDTTAWPIGTTSVIGFESAGLQNIRVFGFGSTVGVSEFAAGTNWLSGVTYTVTSFGCYFNS